MIQGRGLCCRWPTERTMHPKRVLIVDDSRLARMMLRKALPPSLSAEVVEAANGNDAIRCIESSRVDLMFLDLTMPIETAIRSSDPAGRRPDPPHHRGVSRRPDVGGGPSAEARRARVPREEHQAGRAERCSPASGPPVTVALLSVDKRDALQELVNIGMGAAGAALAKALGAFVQLAVPGLTCSIGDASRRFWMTGRGPIRRSKRYASRSSGRSWARA